MNEAQKRELGVKLLRYGLVVVFLYFGIMQLLTPSDWTGWLPAWSAAIPLTPETLIMLNGGLETVLGVALLAGFLTRWTSLILGLHMALITLEIGWTEIGVRDFGITIATLALSALGADSWTLDTWRARK